MTALYYLRDQVMDCLEVIGLGTVLISLQILALILENIPFITVMTAMYFVPTITRLLLTTEQLLYLLDTMADCLVLLWDSVAFSVLLILIVCVAAEYCEIKFGWRE
jgi:hypothetical protein